MALKNRAVIPANWFPMVDRGGGIGTSVRRNFRPISSLLFFPFDSRTFASFQIFLAASRFWKNQTLLYVLDGFEVTHCSVSIVRLDEDTGFVNEDPGNLDLAIETF